MLPGFPVRPLPPRPRDRGGGRHDEMPWWQCTLGKTGMTMLIETANPLVTVWIRVDCPTRSSFEDRANTGLTEHRTVAGQPVDVLDRLLACEVSEYSSTWSSFADSIGHCSLTHRRHSTRGGSSGRLRPKLPAPTGTSRPARETVRLRSGYGSGRTTRSIPPARPVPTCAGSITSARADRRRPAPAPGSTAWPGGIEDLGLEIDA